MNSRRSRFSAGLRISILFTVPALLGLGFTISSKQPVLASLFLQLCILAVTYWRGAGSRWRRDLPIDLNALVLIQLIFRSYLDRRYDPTSAAGAVLVFECIIPLYSLLYLYFRRAISLRWHGFLGLFLLLVPPTSVSTLYNDITNPSGMHATAILLALSLWGLRGRLSFSAREGAILFIALALQALAAAVAVLQIQNLTSTLAHVYKFALFLVLFFSACGYFRFRSAMLCILIMIAVQTFWFFAIFLVSPEAQTWYVAEVNWNTAAMLFEPLPAIGLWLITGRYSKRIRALGVAALMVSICALIVSESRGAQLAILLSLLIVGCFSQASKLMKTRTWTAFACIVVTCAGILVVNFLIPFFAADLSFSVDENLSTRFDLWQITLYGVSESIPGLLFGYGTFGPYFLSRHIVAGEAYPFASRPDLEWLVYTHPHSDYLSTLYGYGILGLIAFLLFMGVLIKRGVEASSSLRSPGALCFFCAYLYIWHGLVDPGTVAIVSGALFWTFSGGLFAQTSRTNAPRSHTMYGTGRFFRFVSILGIVLSLAFLPYRFQKKQINAGILAHQAIIRPDASGTWQSLSPDAEQALATAITRLEGLKAQYPFIARDQRIWAELAIRQGGERADEILAALCRAHLLSSDPNHLARLIQHTGRAGYGADALVCGAPRSRLIQTYTRWDPFGIVSIENPFQF